MDSPATVERRVAERHEVQMAVTLTAPAVGQLQGNSVNLSTHGVLVAIPHEIALGTEVRVVLELPDERAPLALPALVVRVGRPKDSTAYEVALCFMQPSPATVRRLSEIVYAR